MPVIDDLRSTPPETTQPGLSVEPTDLATIYQQLAASGELAAFEVSQRFYEVGSFAGLVQFEDYLKKAEPR